VTIGCGAGRAGNALDGQTLGAQQMGNLHRSIFLKEVKAVFPQLRDEINAQQGLLHLEMHVLADFVQRAITRENAKDVASCFKLVEKYQKDGDDRMKNAIGASFVEHLHLHNAEWAWNLMGPMLRSIYLQLVDAGMADSLPYLQARRS
jgi:hypothetical protein